MASSANQDDEQIRNWLELPQDVTSTILSKLGTIEILTSAQKVCSFWRCICKDPLMWRKIEMRGLEDFWGANYDFAKICRVAIDRSCGQLEDIDIEEFATDDLLKHIADSTAGLRRLCLDSCDGISDAGLAAVVDKLPQLEELEISYCSISSDALKAIGHCCPNLKTLKFNNSQAYPYSDFKDDEALAIAGNMPELRHLEIMGNKLSNDGLVAILDGCSHLESLDLRECDNVYLAGDLGRRCAEQIKKLRRPSNSKNYEIQVDPFDEDEYYPWGFSDLELDIDLSPEEYDYYGLGFSSDSDIDVRACSYDFL